MEWVSYLKYGMVISIVVVALALIFIRKGQ